MRESDWWVLASSIRPLDVKIIGSARRPFGAISLVSLQLAGGEVMGTPRATPRSRWAPGGAVTGHPAPRTCPERRRLASLPLPGVY